MLFNFSENYQLTETTSLEFLKKVTYQPILTPLHPQPIATTIAHQGRSKTPILLIHGFDSSLLEFRRLFPIISQECETFAVDLLGFGFTERIPQLRISPEQIKTHLYCTWKTLISKPVILVGASMGGATAIDFTLTYPQCVEKLVLIDSAGLEKPPILGKFMFSPLDYLATAFLRNPQVRQKISESAYYDKQFASKDAQICAALHLNCEDWGDALISFTKSGGYGSFAKVLPNLEQETLILWGKQDKILGIKSAFQFQKILSNASLIWLDQCGHVPHLEKPEFVAQSILKMLSKVY